MTHSGLLRGLRRWAGPIVWLVIAAGCALAAWHEIGAHDGAHGRYVIDGAHLTRMSGDSISRRYDIWLACAAAALAVCCAQALVASGRVHSRRCRTACARYAACAICAGALAAALVVIPHRRATALQSVGTDVGRTPLLPASVGHVPDRLDVAGRTYLRLSDHVVMLDSDGTATRTVLDRVLVARNGGLLEDDRGHFRYFHDAHAASRDEAAWSIVERDGHSLVPLAIADDTVVFEDCAMRPPLAKSKSVCTVFAMRSGTRRWSHAAGSLYVSGLRGTGRPTSPVLAQAPRLAWVQRHHRLVGLDVHGAKVATSAHVPREGDSAIAVDDRLVIVPRPGSSARHVVVVRPGRHDRSGSRFACSSCGHDTPHPLIGVGSLYYFADTHVGEATHVHSIDLRTGRIRALPNAVGMVPALGPRLMVTGHGGRYTAYDARTGKRTWTVSVPDSDPGDGWVGTGLASVGADTVAVWTQPSGRYQVVSGIRSDSWITMIDARDGRVLTRYLLPRPQGRITGVEALSGHRAVAILPWAPARLLDASSTHG